MRLNHNFGADTHGTGNQAAIDCQRPHANSAAISVKSAPILSNDDLAGDTGSGGSAPGQLRAGGPQGQSCAADTSDAAVGATQAEHSTTAVDLCGCGVPGDPAPRRDTSMNHQQVEPCVRSSGKRVTTRQLEQANESRLILEAALQLLLEGKSQAKAAQLAGVSEPWLCRALQRATTYHGEKIDAAEKCRRVLQLPLELLAKQSPPGRKPKHALTETEAAAVAAHNLQSNRTETAGSPQEALKHAIKRGEVAAPLANILRQREADGKPILTESMRRAVEVGETVVRSYRTPRNAWLKYVQSPGSLQITVDDATGFERMIQPGEWQTIDDATINLILTVPIERPGDKCWEKFGVMCGRFQFIVPADHRCYFIPGFSFTARPRSSYRAEDLTATMHTAFREHGMPRGMFLEMGISKVRTSAVRQIMAIP